jgi:hypothetical protein
MKESEKRMKEDLKDLQSNDTKTRKRFEEIGKEFMHSLEKKGLRYNTIKSSANLYRDSTVSLSNLCPLPFYEHTDLKRAWIGSLTLFLYEGYLMGILSGNKRRNDSSIHFSHIPLSA